MSTKSVVSTFCKFIITVGKAKIAFITISTEVGFISSVADYYWVVSMDQD
jgi:hypothetical protein